jgi:tetratricopeptide (TPR) repeat protein
MRRLALLFTLVPALAVLGCEPQAQQETAETIEAASMGMMLPATTASDAALAEFNSAMDAWDVGRWQDAHKMFVSAAEKDPGFARAYLHAGNTAGSWEKFKSYLDKAEANAATASEGEQLIIEWNTTLLDNDLDKRHAIAKKLVEMFPAAPRSLHWLGSVQETLQQHAESRATYAKALELDADFIPALTDLGFSYLNYEPKDYSKAEMYVQKTVELEADEPVLWVNLGDIQRGSNRLMEARDSYRKATELDAMHDLAWSKSGHANSFLGYYDEARSDFDQAMATAKDAQKVGWGSFKAFVHVYAGDPAAAVEELKGLYESIETAGIPEDQVLGTKIGTLSQMSTIAMHFGMLDIAAEAVAERNKLDLMEAETVGTEDFTRRTNATIAWWEGTLAARQGDFATARAKADENKALREPESNPRKLEVYHNLMGLIEMGDGNYAAAVEHYRQGSPNNPYVKYHRALAEAAAGNTEEANRLFKDVAEYNFNSAAVSCVKKDAMERVKSASV